MSVPGTEPGTGPLGRKRTQSGPLRSSWIRVGARPGNEITKWRYATTPDAGRACCWSNSASWGREGFIKEEQFELGLEGEAHEANQSQENRGMDQEEGENYQ